MTHEEEKDPILEEIRIIIENGEEVPAKTARRLLLALSWKTHTELQHINGRLKKVEKAAEEWTRYPTLLWLLRHKTKNTVAVIIVVFVLLSAFYVSGIRAPIMEFLGLPPLIPPVPTPLP